MNAQIRAEFGDFQTPPTLAEAVCRVVAGHIAPPDIVAEPTCGLGAFLVAAGNVFPTAALQGWDINGNHLEIAATTLKAEGLMTRATLRRQDFFDNDWERTLKELPGRLLILGNPPWVTNSAVSAMNGGNLPDKENFLGLKGMAAKTGKSNFDISEWILIRLLRAVHGRNAVIAMLCKTATARKVLRYAWENDGRVASAALYKIDAMRHFGAAVDACLLLMQTGSNGPCEAELFESFDADGPSVRFGLAGRDLVYDIRAYRALAHLEGLSSYQWRSGIKHDCAAVMELRIVDGEVLENGLEERQTLEPEYVYPLLKCTDLARGRITPTRSVLVTQRFVGDDTTAIALTAPRTWNYLQRHQTRFEARKSSIYKGKKPFSIFGIGDYSFSPWKVAVSALHRSACFQVIQPHRGRPVMLDDTCYFLSFTDEEEARLVCDVVNSSLCRRFLDALVFPEAKRSLTVDLLQRLNLRELAQESGFGRQWEAIQRKRFRCDGMAAQMELVMTEPSKYKIEKLGGRRKRSYRD